MSVRSSIREFLRMCGHAINRTVHERLDTLERHAEGIEIHLNSLEEGQGSLLQAAIHSVEKLHSLENFRIVETAQCPEAALMAFLYSYLPERKAAAIAPKPVESLIAQGFEIGEAGDETVGLVWAEVEAGFEGRVRAMRARGYAWHIVIDRGGDGAFYHANQTVPQTGGAAFFFRDYEVFAQGLGWCAATLRPVYFRPGLSHDSSK